MGLLMTDSAENVAATHVLFQGDHKSPRDVVQAGFLSVFDPQPATIAKSSNSSTTGRRLTLANWIASPDNPLTARVFVNRVWQQPHGPRRWWRRRTISAWPAPARRCRAARLAGRRVCATTVGR